MRSLNATLLFLNEHYFCDTICFSADEKHLIFETCLLVLTPPSEVMAKASAAAGQARRGVGSGPRGGGGGGGGEDEGDGERGGAGDVPLSLLNTVCRQQAVAFQSLPTIFCEFYHFSPLTYIILPRKTQPEMFMLIKKCQLLYIC